MLDEAPGGGGTEVRTFLIADVRGYTRFTQLHGDEAAAELAGNFAAIAKEVVERGGGHLVELRGDEALVVFGSPRQALRCALDLQARFVDETIAVPRLPLGVGIGVDSGEAVPVAGGYRGAALNLAARLCSIARPGEVLASAESVHLARRIDGIRYVDRGRQTFKGIDHLVTVMRVMPERDDPASRPEFIAAVRPDVAASRNRRRRRVISAGAVALVVFAAAISTVALRTNGGTTLRSIGSNSIGRISLGSNHLVSSASVGAGPGAVAADAQSVWVSNTIDGTVSRFDLSAPSAPANTIPIGRGGDAAPRPTGIALSAGAVWVTDANSRALDRIDPGANRVVETIAVGNGPTAVAYGANAIWVTNGLDDTVSVVDARADRVIATIAVGGEPSAVAYGDDSAWVADAGSASVVRIDARTHEPTARIAVGNGPDAIAIGAGGVWVANALDGTVSHIDARRSQVVATVPVGRLPNGLAFTGHSLWVTDGNADSLTRVDVRSNVVADVVKVGNTTGGAAVAGGSVWVSATGPAAEHRGGTLRVIGSLDALGGENNVSTLDPAFAYRQLNWNLISLINDGLVTFRRSAAPAGTEVVPDLATALPQVTDGGRTYTFLLHSRITYSDGRPLRASDVRASFERMVPAGPPYFDSIIGAQACVEHADQQCDLSKGITTDDQASVVTFHLTAPDPELLFKLAMPFGAVLPAGTSRADLGLKPHPATGPYMLGATRVLAKGRRVLEFVRNPHFRQWSAVAQPAGYLDGIDLTLVPSDQNDPSDNVKAVLAGHYDWTSDQLDPEPLANVMRSHSSQLHAYIASQTSFFFLNTHVHPFDDARVRRAVNLAFDRNAGVEALGGPLQAQPTCQVLPPTLTGYAPFCPYTTRPNAAGVWTGPDLAGARELVRAAHAEGATVTLLERPDDAAIQELFIKTLNAIGLRARLKPFADTSDQALGHWFAYVGTASNHVPAGYTGWTVDYPEPSNMFVPLLTCASENFGSFCDPAVDSLIDKALAQQQSDPAAAAALWARADHAVTGAAAWVPVTNPRGIDVVSQRVGDYQNHPEWGLLLDQVWVR